MTSLDAIRRGLALAGIAGVGAGVVAGLGSRVAMRISATVSPPELLGTFTSNENTVGQVTLGGTFGLIVFGGVLPGIVGSLLFVAVEPWLAPLGRWRGVAFGLALLALFGSVVIEPTNFDFRRFGPAALNVLMFAALFPLYGIVLALLADPVARRLDANDDLWRLLGALGIVASLAVLGFALAGMGNALLRGEAGGWIGAALFGLLGLALAFRVARLAERGAVARAASYLALALPVLFGLVLTLSGIARLLA